jgi:recombinational DNA repair protein RecR
MAYTPELSYRGSATLRRLAWFRGKPMTKTLEALLEATGRTMAEIRAGEVCAKCKDSSTCEECAFQPAAKKSKPTTKSSK